MLPLTFSAVTTRFWKLPASLGSTPWVTNFPSLPTREGTNPSSLLLLGEVYSHSA